jgi:MinD superfamily P-loop ATPase
MKGRLRQVVVLSGKGGTGKTTVSASMAFLATRPIIADCDVDASNLSLVLQGKVRSSQPFCGSLKAEINPLRCDRCGKCEVHCHFLAIREFRVDPTACEGCGVCQIVCPVDAVNLREAVSGTIFVRDTPYGTLVDAEMLPGEPNSGKLAAKVRSLALEEGGREQSELLIIDGPPGTGCPVISSITGTDLVIIVTEPTASGWHDLGRVVDLAAHFDIPCAIIVNKFDLDPCYTDDLTTACEKSGTRVLGNIPYDENVSKAIINGLPLPLYSPYSPAAIAIRSIWEEIEAMLEGLPGNGPLIKID